MDTMKQFCQEHNKPFILKYLPNGNEWEAHIPGLRYSDESLVKVTSEDPETVAILFSNLLIERDLYLTEVVKNLIPVGKRRGTVVIPGQIEIGSSPENQPPEENVADVVNLRKRKEKTA